MIRIRHDDRRHSQLVVACGWPSSSRALFISTGSSGGNVDLGSFDVAHYQSLIRIIKLVLAPPNGIPMTGTSQLYNSNSPFKILLGSQRIIHPRSAARFLSRNIGL